MPLAIPLADASTKFETDCIDASEFVIETIFWGIRFGSVMTFLSSACFLFDLTGLSLSGFLIKVYSENFVGNVEWFFENITFGKSSDWDLPNFNRNSSKTFLAFKVFCFFFSAAIAFLVGFLGGWKIRKVTIFHFR